MPSSSDDSQQDLKYPPVHINRSLQQVDLEDLIMRSTPQRPQEAGSSLEESTFELLGLNDSMMETSDDEAHTESIASTDGNTPDDASSFSDDDDVDYGTDGRHSFASLQAEAPEQQHHDARSIHSAGDSTLTEVPMHRGYSGHSRGIRLDEQPGQDDGVSQGAKVIRTFPDENGTCYSVFDEYGCSEVRVVVKAALSNKSISTPDSYRICYIGMPDKWDEDVITTKITAALTASPGTSRSIMVQGQLEPYGPIMHVDRCTYIQVLSTSNEPARIALRLDNGEQLSFGQGRRSTSEARPDLVIFCHPSAPRTANDAQEYNCAREAFDREQMPYLELTSVRQYHHGALSYDSRSLAVCMEGRDSPEADFRLKEVLPIDHFTFSDLEPSQVNRHLALISPHMVTVSNKSHEDVQKSHITTPDLAKALLAALSAMVIAYLFGPTMMLMLASSNDAVPAAFTPYSELCSSPSSTFISSSSVTAVPSSSIMPTPRELTIVPPQIKPQTKPVKKTEKTIHFRIKPTNDHQFILVPNKEMLNARKKPQLQIHVVREAESAPIRFNRTISGIYVVDLEQQYPFGMFNVTIASFSKPLLEQSFEIALGHNKSMLDQLIDSTIWNLGHTPSNLFNITNKAALALRVMSDELMHSQPDIKTRFYCAKKALEQMGSKAAALKQVPEATWVGMREVTAPIRRSSSLSKLRMRALWVRCRAETAVGLSRSVQDGKKSWACSKLGNTA
ncbi:hypothetical protein HBI75_079300 [Parastagonospora nodorum]|nr:hypothetical protein HBI75_079300 [Parastagonospora nodorum]KAH5078459.1 hypothetical protein HBH95_097990 [Parastagonospora nodorum]KAH5677062.1 hypothetical protein HBI21_101470 [Parastagonospora nodorum]